MAKALGDPSHKEHCLVLGGQGFIGSHLVNALLMEGYRVRSFGRRPVSPNYQLANPNLEHFQGNFLDSGDIDAALEGCDFCFHLISTTLPKSSNADPCFDIESNLIGSVRFLNHAVKHRIKKVIFVSSGGTVYGVPKSIPIKEDHPTNPICSYGITKLSIEKYLGLYSQLEGLDYQVLRLANPYGVGQLTRTNQGAVAVFLGKVLRNESVEIWGDGSVTRDYLYISDVISALLQCLRPQETRKRVLNIGSGHGLTVNQVLDAIENITGVQANRQYIPGRTFDVPSNILDISEARKHLNWEPQVTFEEGIAQFANWLQDSLSH